MTTSAHFGRGCALRDHAIAAVIAFAPLATIAPRAACQPHSGHGARAATTSPADSIDEAAFIAAARAGTVRYRDLAAARADGYRPLGGELPSLGEHWVQNRRALADAFDPAAPSILIYVRIGGQPVLAGVAYTRFLAPTAPMPEFPRSQPHAWHEHNGGVAEEVLPLAHAAPQLAPNATPTRLRIAVMHAWIGIENPAGMWAAENWGLPYARVGLVPASGASGLEARALSLATAGDYYLRAIVSTADLDVGEVRRVERIFVDYAGRAGLVAGLDPAARVERLRELWPALWREIGSVVRPEVMRRLAPLQVALGGEER